MHQEWMTIEAADDLRLGAVMPAWFVGRMMADHWCFGLLLSTGLTMIISRIDSIHIAPTGTVLLDVEMSEEEPKVPLPGPLLRAPTGRTRATVNLAHIVAAFEVADISYDDMELDG